MMTKQPEQGAVFYFSAWWYCILFRSVLLLCCSGACAILTDIFSGTIANPLQDALALVFSILMAVVSAGILLSVLSGKMCGLPILVLQQDALVVRCEMFYRRVITIPWQKIDEIDLDSRGLYFGWYFCLRIDSSLMRSLFPKKKGLDADVLRVDTWIVQGRPQAVLHTLRHYWQKGATSNARLHRHLFAARHDGAWDFENWLAWLLAALFVIGMIYVMLNNVGLVSWQLYAG